MQLACSHCNAAVPTAKIDMAAGRAQCPECRALVDVAAALETAEARHLPPPRKIHLEKTGGQLVIVQPWRNRELVSLIPFCLIWDAVLVGWYWQVLQSAPAPYWDMVLMLSLSLVHFAVGAYFTYTALCLLVNRSTLRADGDYLSMRHGPLPYWSWRRRPLSDGDLPLRDVAKFAAFFADTDFPVSGVHREWGVQLSLPGEFTVCAVLHDGEQVPVFVQLTSAQNARWLEQFLNDYLGVAGADFQIGAHEREQVNGEALSWVKS